MRINQRVNVNFTNESHYIRVIKIEPEKVVLEIKSDPLIVTLSTQDTANVDLNNDNIEDITIRIIEIKNQEIAILEITALKDIDKKEQPKGKIQRETSGISKEDYLAQFIFILLGVIIAVVLITIGIIKIKPLIKKKIINREN